MDIDDVLGFTEYDLEQAEQELRIRIVDFTHRPEIQCQITEAFRIWMGGEEPISKNIQSEEDIDDLTFTKFFDWFIYDFKSFDNGERIIDRFWKEEGESLLPLERFLLTDWKENLYSFFEFEEVVPEQGCRLRDIFSEEVIYVKDESSSRQLTASDIIGARPIKVGSVLYFSGVISIYPSGFKSIIADFTQREFEDYKKSLGREKTFEDYLRHWGFLIERYIEDFVRNPQFLTPERDKFTFAFAKYRVGDYKESLGRIKKLGVFEEISGGTDELRVFSWIKEKENKREIIGTLELEEKKLTLECYSVELLEKGKRLIEDALGKLITRIEDSVKSVDTFLNREGGGRGSLPKGVKTQKELDGILDGYYEEWIDIPHPSLGNRTPREMAGTKEGKKFLEGLLAELEELYEGARLRGEPYYDVRKLRRKLVLS